MKQQPCNRLRTAVPILLWLPLVCRLTPAAESPDAAKTRNTASPAWYRGTDPQDADDCRQNMHRIHDAILAFQRVQKRLPLWLSELVPNYLDRNSLVCPY